MDRRTCNPTIPSTKKTVMIIPITIKNRELLFSCLFMYTLIVSKNKVMATEKLNSNWRAQTQKKCLSIIRSTVKQAVETNNQLFLT